MCIEKTSTPRGITFTTNENVVVQFDTNILGSTVESLILSLTKKSTKSSSLSALRAQNLYGDAVESPIKD